MLDRLVQDPSSPFELVSERALRLSLPEDDALLRSFLAHEIETDGESETLVKWALKFTASNNVFLVLRLKTLSPAPTQNIFDLFSNSYAPSLREQFGEDEIYVSPNAATAQMQVELLFPDLNLHVDAVDEVKAATRMSHTLSASEDSTASSQCTTASTAATSAPSVRPPSRASNPPSRGSSTFRARAVPASVSSKPSIEPRLSKAAALRMGVSLDSPGQRRSTASPTKPVQGAGVGISGVAKRPVQQPGSLKAPSIAPRLNKAAVARQGGSGGGVVSRPQSAASSSMDGVQRTRKEIDFSNTPGHKRLSMAGNVASTAPPTIAPRQNRASMSRIQGVAVASPRAAARAPPSAYNQRRAGSLAPSKDGQEGRERKEIDFAGTPGHKRASLSLSIPSLAAPSLAPRQKRASLARTQPSATPPTENRQSPTKADFTSVPGHKRASLSLSIPSLAAPTMAPRQNRASLARTRPSTANAASPAPSPMRNPAEKENKPQHEPTDFAKVPGHKRNSLSFALASLKQPAIQPRLNKAAGARIGAGSGAGRPNTSS